MHATTASDESLHDPAEIQRRDTGIRIALTILFTIAAEILRSILGLVVVFGLIWSFVTRRAPAEGLRAAANRLIGYDYRIARWLTWNEREIPFPFAEFPEALEPSDWDPAVRESDALGFDRAEPEPDGDFSA